MQPEGQFQPDLPTLLGSLEQGDVPLEFIATVKPSFGASHANHKLRLATPPMGYEMPSGVRIAVAPGIYQPHPSSSTVAFLRALCHPEASPASYGKVLDLGAGSGAVGLVLLQRKLANSVDFADQDPAAIRNILENWLLNQGAQRCFAWRSDMFEEIPPERAYDTIVANLPFCHATGEIAPALTDPGGEIAQRFFHDAPNFLLPGGSLWFTWSNLSDPAILQAAQARWSFELRLAEYSPKTGVWIFTYRAVPK